ncbi:MAG: GntR family transcriptional regulator [Rhodobacteraceae bacterium]|jgi:DNA-binding GntR family transcriptional regulator|nr:GntR family transcriptional regulator [Paracoccaceae bacterium]
MPTIDAALPVSGLVLTPVVPVGRPSVADQVFEELRRRILALDLPPGARLSEVDVAAQMDVSRQPVRDAFYRLSKLGLLSIRPQRATTVTLISEAAVLQARFVRTALEVETVREAARRITADDLAGLRANLEAQDRAITAGDRATFHALDDAFHRAICDRAGVALAWDLIAEMKSHMDRVRMLSLSFASRTAYDDHLAIFAPLARGDGEGAAAAMRVHLSRILDQIARIRAANHDWFEGEAS